MTMTNGHKSPGDTFSRIYIQQIHIQDERPTHNGRERKKWAMHSVEWWWCVLFLRNIITEWDKTCYARTSVSQTLGRRGSRGRREREQNVSDRPEEETAYKRFQMSPCPFHNHHHHHHFVTRRSSCSCFLNRLLSTPQNEFLIISFFFLTDGHF